MKVALIGASGFVGKAILNELLSRGHFVTGIVRHPEKIASQKNLTLAKADAFDEGAIANAVKGHDAVISAYNSGWSNPNIYDDFINASKSIQAGVKKSGVKRYIVIGGAGSLYVADGVQLVDSPQFPEEYKAGATAARDYYTYIKNENDLDWTFFSPAIEMHQGTAGVRRGAYRTALDNPVFDENGRSILSVEDLAVAIVDELENPKHIKQRFTAAY
ncbi:NAD(P)-dependent oxidoreductase [Parafilimonas sp.]|uniref:NAD(P)-dependent oxidoreductase n=1 Tax=Parafilimonas sp. TaxID=1969739 RepID=UPI0039E3DFC1